MTKLLAYLAIALPFWVAPPAHAILPHLTVWVTPAGVVTIQPDLVYIGTGPWCPGTTKLPRTLVLDVDAPDILASPTWTQQTSAFSINDAWQWNGNGSLCGGAGVECAANEGGCVHFINLARNSANSKVRGFVKDLNDAIANGTPPPTIELGQIHGTWHLPACNEDDGCGWAFLVIPLIGGGAVEWDGQFQYDAAPGTHCGAHCNELEKPQAASPWGAVKGLYR